MKNNKFRNGFLLGVLFGFLLFNNNNIQATSYDEPIAPNTIRGSTEWKPLYVKVVD